MAPVGPCCRRGNRKISPHTRARWCRARGLIATWQAANCTSAATGKPSGDGSRTLQSGFCQWKHATETQTVQTPRRDGNNPEKQKETDNKQSKHTETQGHCSGVTVFCIKAITVLLAKHIYIYIILTNLYVYTHDHNLHLVLNFTAICKKYKYSASLEL